MSTIVLKLVTPDVVKRMRVDVNTFCFTSLQNAAACALGSDHHNFFLNYVDDEKESVNISNDSDFNEAKRFSHGKTLRVTITSKENINSGYIKSSAAVPASTGVSGTNVPVTVTTPTKTKTTTTTAAAPSPVNKFKNSFLDSFGKIAIISVFLFFMFCIAPMMLNMAFGIFGNVGTIIISLIGIGFRLVPFLIAYSFFSKANEIFGGCSSKKQSSTPTNPVFMEKVHQISSMGFDKDKTMNALKLAKGNIERAVNKMLQEFQ